MSLTPNPLIAAYLANANPTAPALGTNIAMPSSAPSMGSAVMPAVTPAPVPLTQTQTDINEYNRQKNTGDGISQIQNPLLRGIARAADIAGSVFAPNLAQFIPGTTLHHQLTMGQAANNVAKDQAEEQAAAQTANEAATTAHTKAATDALQNPNDKFTPIQTDTGYAAFDPSKGTAAPINGPDGTQLGTPDKTKPKTIEEQAYEYAVKSGKNPLDAFSAVYGAKNTKDAGLPQQYLDAIASGDTTKAALIKQVIHDTTVQPKIDVHNATAALTGIPAAAPGQNSPMVQAIIDGRAPAPNSRSKPAMAIMQQVMAADPTYDQSRYNTYQAMQKEMTSGKTGAAINSLNTIQEHISRALQNMPDNTGSSALNYVKNATSEAFGGNPTGKYEVDATGIAGEWGKLVAGGVASEAEQHHVQQLLSPNASPQKMRDNLAEVKAMTDGKLAGIQKQIQSAIHPGGGSNGATSLPSAAGISVTAPDGSIHPFATQAQADAFKKLAGIK